MNDNIFTTEYNKLNVQQKIAVDTIEGPVLVVAGPGTGKTQLLSMRVANILHKTDTKPENILCLTFTNKATVNMRDRILKITGGGAKNVVVKTFHSFASEIMNLFPQYFWNGAKLSTATDSITNDILLTVLTKLPIDDPLSIKFAGQFTAKKNIKTALGLVKEAGLTPGKLEAIIKLNLVFLDEIEPKMIDILSSPLSYKNLNQLKQSIDDLPDQGVSKTFSPLKNLTDCLKSSLEFAITQDEGTNKTTNTGKWKRNLLQTIDGQKGLYKERKNNNWWLSLANVYKLYRQQLHSRGYYDYSDMLVEVITALEQNEELRKDVQEQFLYILVDEFQDSNAAQMRLANLISEHPSNVNKPNLMAVGDDDQAIYKFNGAELANLLSFKQTYPDATLVVLTENYRSSQRILDISNQIISQANDRLTTRDPSINKSLVAKNPPKPKGEILHLSYANQNHQFYDVAKRISKTHSLNGKSVAVLARNNKSLKKMAAQLTNLNIPIYYSEQNNILEFPLVKLIFNIISLLKFIQSGDMQNTNYYLSTMLRHPAWTIDPISLWDLAVTAKNDSWLKYMHSAKDEKLNKIADWFFWLNSQLAVEPLKVIVEYIIGLRKSDEFQSPIKNYFQYTKTDTLRYLDGISGIALLLNLVDEYSNFNNGDFDDFYNFIRVAIETNQIIPNEIPLDSGDNPINLLSVHKAKGLEFDTVYIIDAVESNWTPRSHSRLSPINLPLQPAFDDQDDYIRLMYVGLTRAKENIYASSYNYDEKNQDVLATPIISGIISQKTVKNPDTELSQILYENSIAWPEITPLQEKDIFNPRLGTFNLSVTALLDYLDISNGGPNTFKENHLIKLPFAQSVHMSFGSSMHSALEYAQILTTQGKFSLNKIIKHYEETLAKQNMPHDEFIRYLPHGKSILSNLLNSDSFYLYKNSLPEQAIKDVVIDDVRLYGKVDRIDFYDNRIVVIDYKTGKPLTSLFTKNKNMEIKAWRHKTQLTFYCMLLKHSSRFAKYNDISGRMIYLEAESSKDLIREFSPSAEDIEYLERLTKKVWRKIMDLDFPDITTHEPSLRGIKQFESDILNS